MNGLQQGTGLGYRRGMTQANWPRGAQRVDILQRGRSASLNRHDRNDRKDVVCYLHRF